MPFWGITASQEKTMDKGLLEKEIGLYRESAGKMVEYFRENARELPWRNTGDPYKVWISEIMLQQTRIEAVLGYFTRFLEALPTVEALAECPDDLLMKLWEGLGYYSRARNLKKAARIIAEKGFPEKASELIRLPGIGPYTSGAIASIAFGEKAVAVDGNVIRVLSRLCGRTLTKEEAGVLLEAWFPTGGEGEFTQSWMELGETLCTPGGNVKCLLCPLQNQCCAHKENTAHLLPVLPEKKARKKEVWTFFYWEHEGVLALRKRPHKGVLASMWEFPSYKGSFTKKTLESHLLEEGLSLLAPPRYLGKSKHIFTHIEWTMHFWKLSLAKAPALPELLWIAPRQMEKEIPLASAFHPLRKMILEEEEKKI